MTTSRQILLCRNYAHARALFLARRTQPDQGRFIRRRRVVFSQQAVVDMVSVPSDKAVGGAPERGARAVAVIAAILGLGLSLGACSKCDVPDWLHKNFPQGPQSCHDTPPPQ